MITSSHDRRLEDPSVVRMPRKVAYRLHSDLSDVALLALGSQRCERAVKWQMRHQSTSTVADDRRRFWERGRTRLGIVVVSCRIVTAILFHGWRAFVIHRIRPVVCRRWRGRGGGLRVDVLLVRMHHSTVDGTSGVEVITSADERRVIGGWKVVRRLVLPARTVATLVFLQQLRSAPVNWNRSTVVNGDSSRLVLAKDLFVLVLHGQIGRWNALGLRSWVKSAADGRWDVGKLGWSRFAVLLLVLAPLGCHDKVNSQDEDEQSNANAGHDGGPVNSAQAATIEPLRWNIVDWQGSSRPDWRGSRGGGRRAWHPKLDQVGNSSAVTTAIDSPDSGIEPAVVTIEIHQSQIHWIASKSGSRCRKSFCLLEQRWYFEPSFVRRQSKLISVSCK